MKPSELEYISQSIASDVIEYKSQYPDASKDKLEEIFSSILQESFESIDLSEQDEYALANKALGLLRLKGINFVNTQYQTDASSYARIFSAGAASASATAVSATSNTLSEQEIINIAAAASASATAVSATSNTLSEQAIIKIAEDVVNVIKDYQVQYPDTEINTSLCENFISNLEEDHTLSCDDEQNILNQIQNILGLEFSDPNNDSGVSLRS